MKKYLFGLLLFFPGLSNSFQSSIPVLISSGVLQPGTTAGFNVSSGTVANFYATTATVKNINGTSISGMRNRIINGAMRIDQRNEGTPIASASSQRFGPDRWLFVSTQASFNLTRISSSTSAESTFHSQILVTSATVATSTMTAYFGQVIEGPFIADFVFGKSNAKTITLSFMVNSSSAGVFSGALTNSGKNRSYPFTYTVNVSSAWEQKSITVPGDISGTWLTAIANIGLSVVFDLGSGAPFRGPSSSWASANYLGVTGTTSLGSVLNSTWNITNVQIEISSASTTFELRSDPEELLYCLRYYQKTFRTGTKPAQAVTTQGALNYSATSIGVVSHDLMWDMFIPMRAAGTVTFFSPGEASSNWWNATDGATSGASSLVTDYNSEIRRSIRNAQAAGDAVGESIGIHATFDAESGF